MEHKPLYGTISNSGHLYVLHYTGTETGTMQTEGYAETVFDDAPDETPIIDHRTATIQGYFREVSDKCCGVIEAHPQPYRPIPDLTSPAFTPVPLATLIEYSRNAGATITTVGELRKAQGPAPLETYKGFEIFDTGGGKFTGYSKTQTAIGYSLDDVKRSIDLMTALDDLPGFDNPEPDYDKQARDYEEDTRFAEQPTPYDP